MSTGKLLVTMIMAFSLGFIVAQVALNYVTINSAITPWVLITILFFPASFAVQAMLKIPEASEHQQLTQSELKRLKGIIKVKQNKLFILFWVYVIFAVASAALFLLKNPAVSINVAISVSLGLIVASLSSLVYIRSVMDEIQSFKSLMIHRADKIKKKNELLERLK
ncbi:hypothetical protein [Morganella psychrotolerans]|uniref:Uncharacterized protein n=1 Tax=Morganella psychrotolerans TaxID=368603 RepID=A0A1B8HQV5_9GAMM|nr:hypothetical protein [Morganella psychrotolerans]OBU11728.1 hypothetical protein AYY17_03220 [Morganella psychrotolerans]